MNNINLFDTFEELLENDDKHYFINFLKNLKEKNKDIILCYYCPELEKPYDKSFCKKCILKKERKLTNN